MMMRGDEETMDRSTNDWDMRREYCVVHDLPEKPTETAPFIVRFPVHNCGVRMSSPGTIWI